MGSVVIKYEDRTNPYSLSDMALGQAAATGSPFNVVENLVESLFIKPLDAVNSGIKTIGSTITEGMGIKNNRILGLEQLYNEGDEQSQGATRTNLIIISVIVIIFLYIYNKNGK